MIDSHKILLICDDEATSRLLSEKLIVDGGYVVTLEPTGQKGINSLRLNNFDVVIVKFGTSDIDSTELIKSLKNIDSDAIIIVVVEEADVTMLEDMAGQLIYDIVIKPINIEKLFFLIDKGIELRSAMVANRRLLQGFQEQNVSLQKQNTLLAKRIEEYAKNLSRLYEDLRNTYMRTIKVLAQAIDARDHYTHSHSENVAKIAVAISEEMGLSVKEVEVIRRACELHDLGKIGIEDNILSKPTKLNEKEWEQIKCHPAIGAQILEPLTFLNDAIELVRQHHEHYDGSGYPEGRKAENIVLGARIINLADAYEAMRAARSYRKIPLSKEEAILEIKNNSGKQFDPKVVDAFLRIVDKL